MRLSGRTIFWHWPGPGFHPSRTAHTSPTSHLHTKAKERHANRILTSRVFCFSLRSIETGPKLQVCHSILCWSSILATVPSLHMCLKTRALALVNSAWGKSVFSSHFSFWKMFPKKLLSSLSQGRRGASRVCSIQYRVGGTNVGGSVSTNGYLCFWRRNTADMREWGERDKGQRPHEVTLPFAPSAPSLLS